MTLIASRAEYRRALELAWPNGDSVAKTALINLLEQLWDRDGGAPPSVLDYGAQPGTTSDQTAAFNAGLAAVGAMPGGGILTVPWAGSDGFRINGRLDIPANVTLLALNGPDGARPVLQMTAGEAVRMNEPNAGFVGFRIIASHSTSAYQIRLGLDAHRCVVDVEIDNGNSGVVTRANDGRITVVAREMRGTVVRVSGGERNYISARGRNITGFVVYITNADEAPPVRPARYNYGPLAESWVEPALFTAWQLANRAETARGRLGIEALGIAYPCEHNYFALVIRRGSYDAGCTLAGPNNRVDTMISEDCDLGAMSLPSENCSVGSVFARNCLNAVNINANAGGIARNNSVGPAVAIDCTEAGAATRGGQYALWVSGQTRSLVSYCYFGNNLYERISIVSDPMTFGTIAPVHTSGDASDGLIIWRFMRTMPTGFVAQGNSISRVVTEGTTPAPVVEEGGATLQLGSGTGQGWALGAPESRLSDATFGTARVLRWDQITDVGPAFDFRRRRPNADVNDDDISPGADEEVTSGSVLGQLRWWGWRSNNFRVGTRIIAQIDRVPPAPATGIRAMLRVIMQRDDNSLWDVLRLTSAGRMALRRDPGNSAFIHTPVAALEVDDEVVAAGLSYRSWTTLTDAPAGVLSIGYSGAISLSPTGPLTITELSGTFVRFSRVVLRNQTSNLVTLTNNNSLLRLGGTDVTLGLYQTVELIAVTPTGTPQIWMLAGGNFGRPAGTIFPGPFADDTAAAAGGVQIGGAYRVTGGNVAWRQT